ncbi:MAG: Endonuclease/exonuclease/phosphatase [Mycobacterium sp.]|nr:Endonuclease/exonuclease/phosphatase [Mycobacterium sp.]
MDVSGLRLATFNICSGRDPATGAVDPARLQAAVREIDADVLALQEVDRDQPRSAFRDQAQDAATAMGCEPGNWRFAAALHGTPGERWEPAADGQLDDDGPAYGIALLSRLPVLEWSEIRLPAPPTQLRAPIVHAGSRRRARLTLLEDEPRVALVAVIETSNGPLTVVSTHLSFVAGWNVRQLRQLHHQLRDRPRPLVIAGDLNVPGRLPALITGMQPRVRARTFPAPVPLSQLDHVLTDGIAGHEGGHAIHLDVSDHRALVVELPGWESPAAADGTSVSTSASSSRVSSAGRTSPRSPSRT